MYLIECFPEQKNIETIVNLNCGQEGLKLIGKMLQIRSEKLDIISDIVKYLRSEKIIYSLYKYETMNFLDCEMLNKSDY